MKNHLQPVTARANAGIKKTSGCGCKSKCGCGSPAKAVPAAAAAIKIAPKLLSMMGSSNGQKSQESSTDTNDMAKGYSNNQIGSPNKKMKDLSGDGKITQKDVLIGRGVIPAPGKKYGKKY